MKPLKKFSLVYALQICAVLVLFFYPGCLSIIGLKESKAENTGMIKEKKETPAASINAMDKPADTSSLLKYRVPENRTYSLFTGPLK